MTSIKKLPKFKNDPNSKITQNQKWPKTNNVPNSKMTQNYIKKWCNGPARRRRAGRRLVRFAFARPSSLFVFLSFSCFYIYCGSMGSMWAQQSFSAVLHLHLWWYYSNITSRASCDAKNKSSSCLLFHRQNHESRSTGAELHNLGHIWQRERAGERFRVARGSQILAIFASSTAFCIVVSQWHALTRNGRHWILPLIFFIKLICIRFNGSKSMF